MATKKKETAAKGQDAPNAAQDAKAAADAKAAKPLTVEELEKQAAASAKKAEDAAAKAQKALETAEKLQKEAQDKAKTAAQLALENRPKFEYKGRVYAFRVSAPATINIDGKALTQAEILKDETLMAELIEGNNFFVQRINTAK